MPSNIGFVLPPSASLPTGPIMRTQLLLAVLAAVSTGMIARNAVGDWVDQFDGNSQAWEFVGRNGYGVAASSPHELRGVSFDITRASFEGAPWQATGSQPAGLFSFVNAQYANVVVESELSDLGDLVSSGVVARGGVGTAGAFTGYSFSVAHDGFSTLSLSLNRHYADGVNLGVDTLDSVDFWLEGNAFPSNGIFLSLTAVGEDLTGYYSVTDSLNVTRQGTLFAQDTTYDEGFSGVTSFMEAGAVASITGAAQWEWVSSATAVPEPGTVLALSLLGGGAAFKRYRSRRVDGKILS